MNPNKFLLLISIFASTFVLRADDAAPADADQPSKTEQSAPAEEARPAAAKPAPARKNAPPPQLAVTSETDRGLRFNFRGVSLETVLNYLSDAAGFVIIPETDLRGKVDIISTQPLNKQEAVDLLNTILNKNGLAALRNGRTLTIISQEEAKKRDIPVNSGSEPDEIPKTDNIVTQILPMHTLNAPQLAKDLSSVVPSTATITANEAGNALVMTGTQTQIHRVAEIIKALDSSGMTSVRVFALRFADAKTLASVIKDVFSSPGESARDAVRNYFSMRFGGGGEDSGDRHSSRHGSSSGGGGGGSKVTAVADDYSNSVIVSAPEDLMATIEQVVNEVDKQVEDISSVRVFRLKYADAGEMADLLNNLFGDDNKTDENNRPRFSSFFSPPQPSSGSRGGSDESSRAKKQAKVSAVADRRTGSVVVTASKAMMEQIAEMVKDLDSDPAKKQKVYVYSLENADPQQVAQELQDLFQTTTTQSQRQAQQQQSDALSQRQTQAIQQNNTSAGFQIAPGNSRGLSGGQ